MHDKSTPVSIKNKYIHILKIRYIAVIYNTNVHNITVIVAKPRANFARTNDTPSLILTSELWFLSRKITATNREPAWYDKIVAPT